MRLSRTHAGDNFRWHKNAFEAFCDAVFKFADSAVDIVPIQNRDRHHTALRLQKKFVLPSVVGTAIGAVERHVGQWKRQDADCRKENAAIHLPVVQQCDPGARLIAGGLTAVDIFKATGKQLVSRDMGTTKACKPTFKHGLFTDQEDFDAIPLFNPDGTVPIFRL